MSNSAQSIELARLFNRLSKESRMYILTITRVAVQAEKSVRKSVQETKSAQDQRADA